MESLKLLLPLALAACTITTTDEAAIPTTAGAASADVGVTLSFARSNGEIAQAQVEVTVRGAPAALGDGDVLVLRDSLGTTRAFEDDGRDGGGEYEAEIATTDVSLAIELTRGVVLDRTVPIALPQAFTVSAPSSTSRASDLDLAWEAAPPWTMTIAATGSPCLPNAGFERALATDVGAATIQPADWLPAPGACDVTIVVTRGGEVSQIRTLVVHTTP